MKKGVLLIMAASLLTGCVSTGRLKKEVAAAKAEQKAKTEQLCLMALNKLAGVLKAREDDLKDCQEREENRK